MPWQKFLRRLVLAVSAVCVNFHVCLANKFSGSKSNQIIAEYTETRTRPPARSPAAHTCLGHVLLPFYFIKFTSNKKFATTNNPQRKKNNKIIREKNLKGHKGSTSSARGKYSRSGSSLARIIKLNKEVRVYQSKVAEIVLFGW